MQNNPQENRYTKKGYVELTSSYSAAPRQPQRPAQNNPYQQPVQNNPYQQPAQGNPYQQSAQNNPYQQPAQGNPYQQPVQNNSYQQPVQPQPPEEPEDSEYRQEYYQAQKPAPFKAQNAYQAPRPKGHGAFNVILIILIILLVLAGGMAVFSRYGGTIDNKQTSGIINSSLRTSYTGDAVIVRNETLFTQENISRIEFGVREGGQVKRGDTVCTVYTSGVSKTDISNLATYRTQVESYMKTLLASSNAETDQEMRYHNNTVLQLAQDIQTAVHRGGGNLGNLESRLNSAVSERAYYIKQKFVDDQKLARLYDEAKTTEQKVETWTKSFGATDVGVVSFYTDYFERALNLNTYESFSPAEVRSMYNGILPASVNFARNEVPVYRLVRDGSYVVLMLCDDLTWNPTVGSTYELTIESFSNRSVAATVESVSLSDKDLLVRLRISGSVSDILYVRSCHVQLTEIIASIAVPAGAITTYNGEIGVVVIQADGEYFLPVTIISQDSQTAYILPQIDNILTQNSTLRLF